MLILVFLLYIFFASTFTFSKAVLVYGKPIFFIAIRMISAGIILLLYDYFFSSCQPKLTRRSKGLLIQFALFAIYFAFVLEFIGLVHVTSAKACLLYNLSPFITALFSYFIFKERLTKIQWFGLFIGFVGFLPVLVVQQPFETLVDHFLSLPELLVICSTIAASYGWIVLKELTSNGYSATFVNGVGMLGGGLLALVTSFIWEKAPRILEGNTDFILKIFPEVSSKIVGFLMFGWYTLLLILVGNIISYNLYGYLLNRYSATFLSFAGFITPLFAALFGWFFLHEQITWHFFATIIIVFFGLYLFFKEELAKKIIK
ncbi:MAG: DMT family transporter [Candidatus Babeliales bacterium]|jgi:drug/metabolite transporter (DMT)-like permease